MTEQEASRFSGFRWQILTILAITVTFTVLFSLLRPTVVYLSTAIVLIGFTYPAVLFRLNESERSFRLRRMILLSAGLGIAGILGYGAWLVWHGEMQLMVYLFIPALALITYQIWSMLSFGFYQNYWDLPETELTKPLPTLSVVIPAYNEEGYIGPSIQSVVNADYPTNKLEIIVVDDGSTDGTFQEAIEYIDHPSVQVFHKENGGKHSALNYAMSFVTNELVVAIDADSMVAADALKTIIAPLQADSSVGAVAGDVHIANRSNLLTNTQALEYVVGINLYRRLYDSLRTVPVIPGCLGAFRYSALEQIGEYDSDTLTEDFDVTIQLLKEGYHIRASPAITYTEAPETWSDFYQQRIRWYRGNIETLFKHYKIFFNPDHGYLHSVAFPIRLISLVTGPLITILVLTSIILGLVMGGLAQLLPIVVIFTLLGILVCVLALQIFEEDLRLAVLAPYRGSLYKLVNDAITLKALLDIVLHTKSEWTSPDRIRQKKRAQEQQQSD